MRITIGDVVLELERRGYHVTPRRIHDWIGKKLLPKLEHRGRGQGKGWIYYWDDPRVIDQAIAVHHLFEWRRIARDLYLPLFLLGYSVQLDLVHERLKVWLERVQEEFTGHAQAPQEFSDRVAASVRRAMRAPGGSDARTLSTE